MLFAISGSQGSGKSSIIDELKYRGFPIVTRKTSRSILNEWGVTLSEVNNDRPLTVRFQDEILKRKFEDERPAALDTSRVYFTERTYADLFTYALIALGKDNEHSDWINDYFERCRHYQATYSHIFYVPAGKFTVEHDGVRGSNIHYSHLTDQAMLNITEKMTRTSLDPLIDPWCSFTKITQTEIHWRTEEILGHISQYFTKSKKLMETV